jgi:hypothetical protein
MLNLDFKVEANRDAAYKYLNDKLEEAFHVPANEGQKSTEATKNLFNIETHVHIIHNFFEVLLPFEQQKWPAKFKAMNYDSFTQWPETTAYWYTTDVISPPFISPQTLHFGYALHDDKLIKSAFFVIQNFWDYKYPQGMVIDPLAHMNNIKPEIYVGCTVEKEDIEAYRMNRKNPINPLEAFVRRKNQKAHEERIRNSEEEFYHTQMTYEPGWFSDELMELAVERDWFIPHSTHNDELRVSYERAKKRKALIEQ